MKKVIALMLIVIPLLSTAQQKTIGQLSVAALYPLIHKVATPLMTGKSPVFSTVSLTATTPKVKSPVGPRDYYQQSFGYFCKREWDWEKQTKVPVKLRLGSYQEAQRIEGKR
jgi:hypothetical protein